MPDKASKLLEKMRRSSSNWKRHDIIRLYKAHGFIESHGGKHPLIYHPDYPQLAAPLPSNIKNVRVYVRQAVDLVDRLIELKSAEEKKSDDRD